MDVRFRWGKQDREKRLLQTEALIRAALPPVKPRPEYVRDLKSRLLTDSRAPQLSIPRKSPLDYGLLIIASLLSGMLLIIMGIRGLSALGKWQQVKQQLKQKAAPPLHPVV